MSSGIKSILGISDSMVYKQNILWLISMNLIISKLDLISIMLSKSNLVRIVHN